MATIPISPLGLDSASVFGLTKADIAVADGERTRLVQFGASYLEPPGSPIVWPEPTTHDDAVIETFLVDPSGDIQPLGVNDDFNDAWLPLVQAMATAVRDAAARLDITFDGPLYVTASTTPHAAHEGRAHFDDDQFVGGDGVGLVAICGAEQGPRIAVGELEFGPLPSSPGQLVVTEDHVQAFAAGDVEHQQADPDRIVVFPQFGQLHAGAVFEEATPGACRSLLVLRAKTVPRRV